jgi:hypothetical protein
MAAAPTIPMTRSPSEGSDQAPGGASRRGFSHVHRRGGRCGEPRRFPIALRLLDPTAVAVPRTSPSPSLLSFLSHPSRPFGFPAKGDSGLNAGGFGGAAFAPEMRMILQLHSAFRPPERGPDVQPVICGTARVARALGIQFIAWERCGHMSGLSVRHMTAGLDEVRGASGLIKGARSRRVTGFSLSHVGISSQGYIVCVGHLTSAGLPGSSLKRRRRSRCDHASR